jgi:hypothetical protein
LYQAAILLGALEPSTGPRKMTAEDAMRYYGQNLNVRRLLAGKSV